MSASATSNPAVVWHRSFRSLVASRASSTLAFQVQAVAVGWQIYALTHSTFQLGMVGLAQFLPSYRLNPVFCVGADAQNRRNISATCHVCNGLTATVLAAGSIASWLSA